MTELREFARRSKDFEKLGVRLVPLSVDDRQYTRAVWEKVAAKKFTILSDSGAVVAKKYGLLHQGGRDARHGGAPGGSDIALRTTLLIGPDGRERWRRVSQSVPDIPTADETLAKIEEAQEQGPTGQNH